MTKILLMLGALVAVAGLAAFWWQSGAEAPQVAADPNAPIVSPAHPEVDRQAPKPEDAVTIPDLTPVAKRGELAYVESCAACHGINAAGTEQGPPLIHNLYRPGHHPDAAFLSAARNGVISHHWQFGNMPPVPDDVSDAELRWIIKYLREMQVANGVR